MPLRESKLKPQSWKDIQEQFAIFYASKDDDGIMWCPVSALVVLPTTDRSGPFLTMYLMFGSRIVAR